MKWLWTRVTWGRFLLPSDASAAPDWNARALRASTLTTAAELFIVESLLGRWILFPARLPSMRPVPEGQPDGSWRAGSEKRAGADRRALRSPARALRGLPATAAMGEASSALRDRDCESRSAAPGSFRGHSARSCACSPRGTLSLVVAVVSSWLREVNPTGRPARSCGVLEAALGSWCCARGGRGLAWF